MYVELKIMKSMMNHKNLKKILLLMKIDFAKIAIFFDFLLNY